MSYTILRPKTHEEWLELRMTGIGSSDVGTILGVNSYDTPYQLWARKKGILPPKKESTQMMMGHVLEPIVADLYEKASGNIIQKDTEGDWCVRNNDKSFLIASPDRIATAQDGSDILLECKTTQRDVSQDHIPDSWMCQVQYLMHITELKEGALAWLKNGVDFDYKKIVYNEAFAAYMIEKVERFWTDNIIGNKEPECLTGEDVVLRYNKSEKGKIAQATDELRNAWDRLVELNKTITDLTAQKDEIVERMKIATADAEKLMYGEKVLGAFIGGKESTKEAFNIEKFKAENAELYAKYVEVNSYVTARSYRPKYS